MIDKNVMEVLMELLSDPGEAVADILSNVVHLEDMIEVAGEEYEHLTDAGFKKFAVEVFEAYVAEERKHLMKKLEFRFDS